MSVLQIRRIWEYMSRMNDVKLDMKRVHLAYAPTEDDADAMIKALSDQGIDARMGDGIRDLYAIGDPIGIEILVFPGDLDAAVSVLEKTSGSGMLPGKQPDSRKKAITWVLVSASVLLVLLFVRVFILHQ